MGSSREPSNRSNMTIYWPWQFETTPASFCSFQSDPRKVNYYFEHYRLTEEQEMWLGCIKLLHTHCPYWDWTISLNIPGCYKPWLISKKKLILPIFAIFFHCFYGGVKFWKYLILPNYWSHQITLLNVSFITMFAFLLVFLLHRCSMFFKCLLYLSLSLFSPFLFISVFL